MEIHGDSWRFMEIHGDSWRFMEIHGDSWRFMEIHGDSWRFMEIHGDSWRFMEIHGDSWRFMEIQVQHGSTCSHGFARFCCGALRSQVLFYSRSDAHRENFWWPHGGRMGWGSGWVIGSPVPGFFHFKFRYNIFYILYIHWCMMMYVLWL